MKYKKIIVGTFVGILVFLFASLVSAQGNEICDHMKDSMGISVGTVVPKYIPYSNEVFNLFKIDGEIVGNVEIKDKKVTSFTCGSLANESSYIVKIKDLETLKDLETAKKPAKTIDNKMSDDDLIIEGQSFLKKVKNSFVRFGIKVASWFKK